MNGVVQIGNRPGAGGGANPGVLAKPVYQGKSSLLKPGKAKNFHGRELTLFDVYALTAFFTRFNAKLRELTFNQITR